MIIMSKEQIILMHNIIVAKTGGSKGIRDDSLLDSAILSPFQEYGGKKLYKTLEERAARLGYGLISNHCFIDGNKRIGIHSMLMLLILNGSSLIYTPKELYDITIDIASGKKDYKDLLDWIKKHQ